jgi:hypothetical protein
MSKNKKEKDAFDEFVESPAAQLGDEFRVELENEVFFVISFPFVILKWHFWFEIPDQKPPKLNDLHNFKTVQVCL